MRRHQSASRQRPQKAKPVRPPMPVHHAYHGPSEGGPSLLSSIRHTRMLSVTKYNWSICGESDAAGHTGGDTPYVQPIAANGITARPSRGGSFYLLYRATKKRRDKTEVAKSGITLYAKYNQTSQGKQYTMNAIFFGSIPGAYFNAVLVCFFVNLLRQNGLVLNPFKAAKLIWPAFKSMLLGFVPAAILSSLIQWLIPSLSSASLIIAPLGALVSAILLHRFLLNDVSNSKPWNIAIAVLACAMILFVWVVLNSLPS